MFVLALLGPAPARSASVWCSETGDSCLSTYVRDGVRFVRSSYAARYMKRDTLCVRAPNGNERCRTGRLGKGRGGVWHLTYRWRRAFKPQGPGVYRVFNGPVPGGWSRGVPSVSFRVGDRRRSHRRSRQVFIRIGASRAVVRPAAISLGSTGYIGEISWTGWSGAVAVGSGTGQATSSSIAPEHRTGPARVTLSRPRACGGRTFYTVARFEALGMRYTQRLGCDEGLHP